MTINNLYNIVMYCFFMIVPLIPLKAKVSIFPISADFIIGGIAIFLGIINLIIKYKKDKNAFNILKDKKIKILTVFIAIFIFISLFSIVYAKDKVAVISETMRFLEYAALFYMILISADETFVRRGLILFYFSMIFAGLFGVFQLVFNTSTFRMGGYLGRGRVYSTFENPNYWGAAVNMLIFYPIMRILEDKESRVSYNVCVFILFFINLIFCFTRGSWLGFMAGLLFLAIFKYRKALFAVPFAVISLYIIPFTRSRLLSIFYHSDATSSERITLWKTGLIMFKEHFWTGLGNGNYITRYREYAEKYPKLNIDGRTFTVHNSYIKMLAELGIFGGVFFTSIYFMLFYLCVTAYKKSKKYKIALLAFICFWASYFVQNFFNNLMFIPQLNVFAWIITALLYKGAYIENGEDKNNGQ